MSRLASSKTAQIWAERIAQCEGSYVDTAQFCQSIGCSQTSFYQWKHRLVSTPYIASWRAWLSSSPLAAG
jgi:hypothetical protein